MACRQVIAASGDTDMFRRFVVVMVLVSCAGLATGQETAEPALTYHNMTVDGLERHYAVFVPDGAGGEALPVVVALHGRGGTGESMAGMTGLSTVAQEEGFIAVYPDGLNREWKYFAGILPGAELNTPDDIAFLDALIDDLAGNFSIDASRVYLLGFSNGGFMAYRVACSAEHNRFAAYGIAAALIYPDMELPCLAAPVRAMVIEHGTADAGVAWDGISHRPTLETAVTSRNVLQSVSFFAGRNGCSTFGADRVDLPSSDGKTHVSRFDFAECTTGKPIRFFAVINGGHTWPGVDRLPRDLAGPVNMDINLGREMWEFLKTQTLTEPLIP